MEIEFVDGKAVERTLARLMAEHDEYHWAVAWGTANDLTPLLLANRAKFRAVTFGLAFAQTDPDLVDALTGIKGASVVTAFPGGTYHPKVYGFRTGKRAAALVGSANFTRGGLGSNHEAAVLISGKADEGPLADALAFAERSAALGEAVTPALAARYRLAHRRAAAKPRLPRDPLADVPAGTIKALSLPLAAMAWKDYADAIRNSEHHDIEASLDLLAIAQSWLAGVRSFHDLAVARRKAIAGIIGRKDKTDSELDRDWGWFGSMRGAGDFKNRIVVNDRSLARALDSIPQRGEVERAHYDRFVRLFRKAFDHSQRTGGVATASRLLAMKRPDIFLCVCGPNIAAASKQLGFAKRALDLDNYWDLVVGAIRAADWYNVDKPDTGDGPLWECRAAMLDAIFYNP
ncbi:phospholipase D family protein [Sphingomonas sp.]|uniref:phospholipase D family protein n=1 Tax=Sphingomonas sp. TaxID=28214 RepID=UPI0025F049CF|nr:phospholipase D family protein [Sphingomonas sp.]